MTSSKNSLRTMSGLLLPCPFCGGDAHLAWYNNGDKQIVAECENPHCMSAVCGSETPEEAVARWNNRVKTDGLKRCPFCGSGAKLEKFNNGECDEYIVQCQNPHCQAETTCSDEAEDVIAIWNRRNNEKGEMD